jgi:hypothetical protein
MTPGYKTTEFWLTLVSLILGALLTSGAIADGSLASQVIGGAMVVLTQLGYAKARADAKNGQTAFAIAAKALLEAPALPAFKMTPSALPTAPRSLSILRRAPPQSQPPVNAEPAPGPELL